MVTPKLSAMVFDGEYWSGWSNSTETTMSSINDAIDKIKDQYQRFPDETFAHRIIDVDNLIIWLSDMKHKENAIRSAKVNYNVDITDIRLGYPPQS